MEEKAVVSRLNRDYYFGVLSKLWLKNQITLAEIKVQHLGKMSDKHWPDISRLFTDKEIKQELMVIKRWSRFDETRQQSLLEHVLCLPILVSYFLSTINGRLKKEADQEMLIKCCYVHVLPKAYLKRELPWQEKTEENSMIEWQAFKDFLREQNIEKSDQREIKKIYLLRHVFDKSFFKSLEEYSFEDAFSLAETWEKHQLEASLFKAVELFDYILYGEEQYVQYGKIEPLRIIVTEHLAELNKLAEEIPGFDLIWSKQTADYFGSFIAN